MTTAMTLPADLTPISARGSSPHTARHIGRAPAFRDRVRALVWIGRRQTESQARLLGRVLGVLIRGIQRRAGV